MLVYDSHDRTIGTDAEAGAAIAGALDTLSSGLFKNVVVNADRTTVYKYIAPHSYEDMVIRAARLQLVAEAAWCTALGRDGTPGIPPCSLYVIDGRQVLAMPYYNGPAPADYDVIHEAVAAWTRAGLGDLHGDNYRFMADGTPVVIDLAGWADSAPTDTLPPSVLDTMPTYEDVEAIAEGDDEYGDDDVCESCGAHETSYRYSTTATPATLCTRPMALCMGAAGHNGAGLTTRMAAHGGRGRIVTGGTAPAPMTAGPAPVVLGQLALPGPVTLCYGPLGTATAGTFARGVSWSDPRHCAHAPGADNAHRAPFAPYGV